MQILKTYKTAIFIAFNLLSLFIGIVINLIFIFGWSRRAYVQAALTMIWCRVICAILGIKVARSGQRVVGGGITVCNHASYIDVFVLGSMRPSSFLTRHDVRDWPVAGWLAKLGGAVFVNRKIKRAAIKAMEEIDRKLDSGITVIIFPEGTTSDGKSVKSFKSTFFNIPVKRNIAVRPASITYSPNVVDTVAWHDGRHIAPHFWNVAGLNRIDAFAHFSKPIQPTVAGADAAARKELCARTYESVVAGFERNKQRH